MFFVSNNISIRYSKKESVNDYLNAFKIMLEQSLNAKKLFSNWKRNRIFVKNNNVPIANAKKAIGIISKNNWQIVNGGKSMLEINNF